MQIKLQVPEFKEEVGIEYRWEEGFCIETGIDSGTIFIKANKYGLISLANHLMNLAQDAIPIGYHLHFDDYNSLEDGSSELIIQKQ